MRRPTEGNGPRGTIRLIDTLAAVDTVAPLAVHRGRPTSGLRGFRPAQQSDETNGAHGPRSVIVDVWHAHVLVGVGRRRWSSWAWVDDDGPPCSRPLGHGTGDFDAAYPLGPLSDEAKVNLDELCGLDRLVMVFDASGKTMQTNPTLPDWRSDGLSGLTKYEQTNPILPEWQYVAGFPRREDEARERSQHRVTDTRKVRERTQCQVTGPRKARERSHRRGSDLGKARERSHDYADSINSAECRSCAAMGSGLRPVSADRGRVFDGAMHLDGVDRPRRLLPKMLNTLCKRRTPSVYLEVAAGTCMHRAWAGQDGRHLPGIGSRWLGPPSGHDGTAIQPTSSRVRS
jgi:hypothetical protein